MTQFEIYLNSYGHLWICLLSSLQSRAHNQPVQDLIYSCKAEHGSFKCPSAGPLCLCTATSGPSSAFPWNGSQSQKEFNTLLCSISKHEDNQFYFLYLLPTFWIPSLNWIALPKGNRDCGCTENIHNFPSDNGLWCAIPQRQRTEYFYVSLVRSVSSWTLCALF